MWTLSLIVLLAILALISISYAFKGIGSLSGREVDVEKGVEDVNYTLYGRSDGLDFLSKAKIGDGLCTTPDVESQLLQTRRRMLAGEVSFDKVGVAQRGENVVGFNFMILKGLSLIHI